MTNAKYICKHQREFEELINIKEVIHVLIMVPP